MQPSNAVHGQESRWPRAAEWKMEVSLQVLAVTHAIKGKWKKGSKRKVISAEDFREARNVLQGHTKSET